MSPEPYPHHRSVKESRAASHLRSVAGNLFLKRSLDISVSLVALFLSLPIMMIVSACIVMTSGFPVLYRGKRVGLDGKSFYMFKFRSMGLGLGGEGTGITKWNDQRITRIGRYLRRTKFDELPQLLNVLAGDMSIVGPRPDTPEVVNSYSADMQRILTVRPGITSNASLLLHDEGKLLESTEDPEEFYLHVLVPYKVSMAMRHVDDGSLGLYLRTLVETVIFVVVRYFRPGYENRDISHIKQLLIDSRVPPPGVSKP